MHSSLCRHAVPQNTYRMQTAVAQSHNTYVQRAVVLMRGGVRACVCFVHFSCVTRISAYMLRVYIVLHSYCGACFACPGSGHECYIYFIAYANFWNGSQCTAHSTQLRNFLLALTLETRCARDNRPLDRSRHVDSCGIVILCTCTFHSLSLNFHSTKNNP